MRLPVCLHNAAYLVNCMHEYMHACVYFLFMCNYFFLYFFNLFSSFLRIDFSGVMSLEHRRTSQSWLLGGMCSSNPSLCKDIYLVLT